MATEQQFYEMLTRIDHPVFPKDMSTVTTADSPFNSIMNRIKARQWVKLQAAIESLAKNSFPNTCDEQTIDRWEQTYFGFNKPSIPLGQRVAELVVKINQKLTMSVPTVISVAMSITGQTPEVVRSIWAKGWVIGHSTIGVDTILASGTKDAHSAIYVLIFSKSISSSLRKLLDNTLTQIEKGGSRHSIVAPLRLWVIGQAQIGVDTTVGD